MEKITEFSPQIQVKNQTLYILNMLKDKRADQGKNEVQVESSVFNSFNA